MAFEAKDYPIGEILNKSVFSIPRNQRRYVWARENWDDLFEDLLFSISQSKPHFVGSIVLDGGQKEDGLTFYTIIDGQQRITTITLLLIAIMKHFHENNMIDDYLGTISYLQSKNNRNQDVIILRSDYHISLDNLISGIISLEDNKESINTFVDTHILSKAKDKIIGDAIKYFYTLIRTDLDGTDQIEERLRSIRSALLDMTAVKIVSTSEEDSYTIFEILNARGQELTAHELLKNYIMRYIQPAQRRDDAKIKWEDMEQKIGTSLDKYIKHYATHRFGETKDKYADAYHAIQKATRGMNISELFDDIKLKSEYYDRIIHPSHGEDGNCSDFEYDIFNFFKVKRFEQFRPIILSLIHQKEKGILSEEKYEITLRYIYCFFICYTIIGEEKSNKLEDVVFKYARLFETNYSDDHLKSFAESLKQKTPGYDWFLNAFKNVGWSNHYGLYKGEKNKTRVQIILEIIEAHLTGLHNVGVFTIEHILNDSESIQNAQIGNLIPLEEKLNNNCVGKSIMEKAHIYSNSGFITARNMARRIQEEEGFDPNKRTEYLAHLLFYDILALDQFDNLPE